jgi:hypothetical protein
MKVRCPRHLYFYCPRFLCVKCRADITGGRKNEGQMRTTNQDSSRVGNHESQPRLEKLAPRGSCASKQTIKVPGLSLPYPMHKANTNPRPVILGVQPTSRINARNKARPHLGTRIRFKKSTPYPDQCLIPDPDPKPYPS